MKNKSNYKDHIDDTDFERAFEFLTGSKDALVTDLTKSDTNVTEGFLTQEEIEKILKG